MLMWAISDRPIPRSYRTIPGFDVHAYRLVNAAGRITVRQVPLEPHRRHALAGLGRGMEISGADSDFHRRDLWEAIEAGAYPEWELGPPDLHRRTGRGVQLRRARRHQDRAGRTGARSTPVSRLVLNRDPDKFFAETEQVAFCVAHVVPDIDFSNDPLLAGRIHSYVDTQIARLGEPTSRDPDRRAAGGGARQPARRDAPAGHPPGRGSYEPNWLGGGCPFQAGARPAPCPSPSRGRPTTTRCGRRPNGSPSTTTRRGCSGRASRTGERQRIVDASASSCRRCRCRRCATRMVSGLLARRRRNSPPPSPTGSHARRSRRRCSRRSTPDVKPRGDDVTGAVAAGPAGRPAAPTLGGSPFWSPTAVRARPSRRWPNGSRADGAVPRFVGQRLGAAAAPPGKELEADAGRETRARGHCSTPWSCLAATRGWPRSVEDGRAVESSGTGPGTASQSTRARTAAAPRSDRDSGPPPPAVTGSRDGHRRRRQGHGPVRRSDRRPSPFRTGNRSAAGVRRTESPAGERRCAWLAQGCGPDPRPRIEARAFARPGPRARRSCVINVIDSASISTGWEHSSARAEAMATRLAALKCLGCEAGVPILYVNDDFGQWRSDFRRTVAHCTARSSPGRRVSRRLRLTAHDLFVLKPKHSGFFGTTLDTLLNVELETARVVITGITSNLCVLFTADDGCMRDLTLLVPSDFVVVSNTPADDDCALRGNRDGAEGRRSRRHPR